MSAARTGRAVVSLPALDLRHEPRHAAELGSQLLLGETVRVLGESRDPGWVRVRNDADGYTGWVSLETHWPGPPSGDKHLASYVSGHTLKTLMSV